jgi:ribosomal-protein-alanine N-acetyltransferase
MTASGSADPVASFPAVRFQPMTPAHLPAVLAIEQASHVHPWTHGNFLDTLRTGWHAQCLMANGELLGYFVAMPGVGEVHLLNLTVAPVHRGKGWACVMLEMLASWARTKGAASLWLEVRSGNTRALHVYEQLGYIRVGLRKGYYPVPSGNGDGAREDAVVMSLKL